jgi:DNA-binding response OmpR family regulator
MRILVVEDEHKIANSIKKGLEQESMTVDVSYDGQTGLDYALDGKFEVIVLDLMLPIINGMEICKKLRENKIHTPIIILTAKGQLDDKIKGLNAGADDYLVKPFAFEELLARIRALARRPKENVGIVLKCGDINLDTNKKELKINNKTVDLSKTEYALLEYFMRHQNMIFSKEQIIDHVWNFDANITENTVEAYVGALRKKKIPIKTIRGFGYKL